MSEHLPKEIAAGTLTLGSWIIPCFNLQGKDEVIRVISQRSFMEVLDMRGFGNGIAHRMTRLLDHPSLKAFNSNELVLHIQNPIKFRLKTGLVGHGFEGEVLVNYCKALLKAREFGVLQTKEEFRYAQRAEAFIVSLAHVGIIALIDAATGYEKERDKMALQAILDKYLRKEFATWAKRFPDEFYIEMFRLRGWEWRGMQLNRPSVVGTYTNDLVYERLAPGILTELQARNPRLLETGERKAKHHQLLTDDIGHPALSQHLYAVIGFMRASTSWRKFYDMIQRAFPKKGDQLPLLDEDEDQPDLS